MATRRRSSVVDAVFADVDAANTGPLFGLGRRTEPATTADDGPPAPPAPPPPVTRVELNTVIHAVTQLQDRVDKLCALMIGPVHDATVATLDRVRPRPVYHDPGRKLEVSADVLFTRYHNSLKGTAEGVDQLDVW